MKKQHPIYKNYLVTPEGQVYGPSGRQLKARYSNSKSKVLSVLVNYEGKKLTVQLKKLVYETFVRLLDAGQTLEVIDGNEENCNIKNISIIGEKETWYPHPVHNDYKATESGKILGKSGRYINPVLCKETGYMRITLKDENNKSVPKLAHRFIYECVHGTTIEESLTIDHLNGDKTCNKVSNLECVSQGVNNQRARALGLNKNFAETSPHSVLTNNDVIEIKRRVAAGETVVSIHKDYPQVGVWALYRIKQNRNWKSIQE